PERAAEPDGFEDRLTFENGAASPIRIEAIVVPRRGEAPQACEIEGRAPCNLAVLAPRLDVLFRPEEQHRGSGKPDVTPPVPCRNHEVNDTPRVDQSAIGRSEEQRLNSSHGSISYAVFCLKKKKK